MVNSSQSFFSEALCYVCSQKEVVRCRSPWRHPHSICRRVTHNLREKREQLCSIFPTKLPWQISNRVLHSCWMIIVAGRQDQYSGVVCGREAGWRKGIIASSLYWVSLSLLVLCFLNTSPAQQQQAYRAGVKMINGLIFLQHLNVGNESSIIKVIHLHTPHHSSLNMLAP